MNDNLLTTAAFRVQTAAKAQTSQNLTILNLCQSVKHQDMIRIENSKHFKNIAGLVDQINRGLVTAQDHASFYMDNIFPRVQTNIVLIRDYYFLHSSIPSVLPPGASEKDWLLLLGQLKDKASEFQGLAHDTALSLGKLRDKLSVDVAVFSGIVGQLNAAVNGDNGALKEIEKQLNELQSKIAGAITGITLSALAILGGVFVILVGAVASIVTAGSANLVVLGGAAIVAAGVGGEVASALALKGLQDAQQDLLRTKENLTSEVQLALGLSTNYGNLVNQMAAASRAAEDMKESWDFLSFGLDELAKGLDKGIINAGIVRNLWLTSANERVKAVESDMSNIINQLENRQELVAPGSQTIGDFVLETAQRMAA